MYHLYLKDGSVNPELYSKEIIIYGCGNEGKKLYSALKKTGKDVLYFCDSDEKKAGSTYMGVPVIAYTELPQNKDYNLALAFFRWKEVLEYIPLEVKENIYADFLFEQTASANCILCQSTICTWDKAHFSPFIQERMFIGESKETKLIHCSKCGLFFSKYRPTEIEMERQYQGYRNKAYQEQRQKFEPFYTEVVNRNMFENKAVVSHRKMSLERFQEGFVPFEQIETVLDYGGDEGQFIPDVFRNATKYVYEVSGNKVVDGVLLLNDIEEVNKIKWDFIMCCHLLEHISDPLSVIRHLVINTRQGAFLYIELPCEERIKYYSDIEISEHINFFCGDTMKEISEIFGLDIVNIEESDIIRVLYRKR